MDNEEVLTRIVDIIRHNLTDTDDRSTDVAVGIVDDDLTLLGINSFNKKQLAAKTRRPNRRHFYL